MSDYSSNNQQNQNQYAGDPEFKRGAFRSSRGPGGRESGGFRIRLSDNEMRSARSIQEAFNLKSTVAVLGFSIRTLAQMLEEGKLDELIANTKSNQGERNNDRRGINRNSHGRNKNDFNSQKTDTSFKPNPFARPEKPAVETAKDEVGVENSSDTKESSEDFQNSTKTNDEEIINEKVDGADVPSKEVQKDSDTEANQVKEI